MEQTAPSRSEGKICNHFTHKLKSLKNLLNPDNITNITGAALNDERKVILAQILLKSDN